jgi:hypothetical protein
MSTGNSRLSASPFKRRIPAAGGGVTALRRQASRPAPSLLIFSLQKPRPGTSWPMAGLPVLQDLMLNGFREQSTSMSAFSDRRIFFRSKQGAYASARFACASF